MPTTIYTKYGILAFNNKKLSSIVTCYMETADMFKNSVARKKVDKKNYIYNKYSDAKTH